MLVLLDRLVQAEENKREETEKNMKQSQLFVMFPPDKFDGSDPSRSYDHWTIFMRYYSYVTEANISLHAYQDFVEVFGLSLAGVAITWFRGIKNTHTILEEIKAAFLGRFNKWGQTMKQLSNAWNTLQFDMLKDDLDSYTLELRLLGDILHMTLEQVLEKFKDSFNSNISAHLLEADDIETAKVKAQQLIFLYQNKQSTTATSVLLHSSADTHELHEHELAALSINDQNAQLDNSKK